MDSFLKQFKDYLKHPANTEELNQLKQNFQEYLRNDANFALQVYQLIDENISNDSYKIKEKSRWLAYELEVNPQKIRQLTDNEKRHLYVYYTEQGLLDESDILVDMYVPGFVESVLACREDEQILFFQKALERDASMIHKIFDNQSLISNHGMMKNVLETLALETLLQVIEEKMEVYEFLDSDLLIKCCLQDAQLTNQLPSKVLLNLIVTNPQFVTDLIGERINDKQFLLDISVFAPKVFHELLSYLDPKILVNIFENLDNQQAKYCLKWILENNLDVSDFMKNPKIKEILAICNDSELLEFIKLSNSLWDAIPEEKRLDKQFLLSLKDMLSDIQIQTFFRKNNFYLSVLNLFSLKELANLMNVSEETLKKELSSQKVIKELADYPKQLEQAFKYKWILFDTLDEDLRADIRIVKAAIKFDFTNIQYVEEELKTPDFLIEVGLRETLWKFISDILKCLGLSVGIERCYEVLDSFNDKPTQGPEI